MKLKVIGTGSAGNCYLLESGKETLMIEAGLPINKIKRGLFFDFSKVVGCIVSHSHNDHSTAIGDVLNCGIKVYASKQTFDAKNIVASPQKAINVVPFEQLQIGSFKVMPFDIKHDVPCLGFLIKHPECGLTLFLTDTPYSEYNFPGLNNVIIEANYSKEIIDKRLASGSILPFLRDRVLHSHLNLENCIKMLLSNDLTAVNNIVLIHLSDGNSDAIHFQKEVEKATNKNVKVAFNGLEMPLNKTPF